MKATVFMGNHLHIGAHTVIDMGAADVEQLVGKPVLDYRSGPPVRVGTVVRAKRVSEGSDHIGVEFELELDEGVA